VIIGGRRKKLDFNFFFFVYFDVAVSWEHTFATFVETRKEKTIKQTVCEWRDYRIVATCQRKSLPYPIINKMFS